MFKLIGTFIALGGLLLGSVETASAHGRVYANYDPPNHYRAGVERYGYTPDRLQHNDRYRSSYYGARRRSYGWSRRYWRDYAHYERDWRHESRYDMRRRHRY